MEFGITTTKNKIISGADELAKFLKSKDGNYRVIAMIENDITTPADCRAAYFRMVDTVRDHTGLNRYDIHNEFKAKKEIVSTKNLSVTDWRNLIKNFQTYTFETLDIII